MRLSITVLGLLHIVYSTDVDQYNPFKYMTFGDPDLGQCHWSCPFQAQRLCAWDQRQGLHRVFLNQCFMLLHNSCFLTDFQAVPNLHRCQIKYNYPEQELSQLRGVLFGFSKSRKILGKYGRGRTRTINRRMNILPNIKE